MKVIDDIAFQTNLLALNANVEAAATQLESIMGGSSKVTDFLAEIATASKEQAEAIDQITQGLEQIDQVTQSNTASAEESAAAEELASQSVQLKNMVATFKLKDTGAAPVAQARQLEYQAPVRGEPDFKPATTSSTAHKSARHTETGIKPVDSSAVIALDDENFDRF